ncbi:DedA family protein [Paraurantiacibacter namhicola]|uniref:Inner membrane protein YabI n=1 Tax=Paraurantiacibacter namhicola TaxID=645517 RepID=A0A1C7D9L2_9SPHN|nr:DedA family protein [Paraurantiacibacter namhicola]ANU08001.1 Inner membrane protein YabI [Paraurantiacibacter namhicola]
MDEIIVSIVEQLGYVGIAVLMALENIFPPMPSEAIMGSAALAIHKGSMQFWPVMIAGTIGTLVGNYAWFWVGDRFGYRRLRPLVDRFGRWLTMEWEDVERASSFFRRHGHWVVMVLRATPIMRTMISLPAGLSHMNPWKFAIFTAVGAAVWNAMLILGTQWLARTFDETDNIVSGVIIAIAVLSVAAYLLRLLTWKPRAER